MTDNKFSVGDPVWSKMKGYAAWPSRIAHHSESRIPHPGADKIKTSKTLHLVYFFGSNNFAWLPEDTIKPYEEFKEKNKNGSKTSQFKTGLKQIEEYIKNGGKATLLDSKGGAISSTTDGAASPSGGDSPSIEASNVDGDLPPIDEEIAIINNTKPSPAASKRSKQSSHNDSSPQKSPVPSSVQKDYSRTPFKSRKSALKSDESTSEFTSPTKRVKTSDDDYESSSLTSPTTPAGPITAKFSASKPTSRYITKITNYNEPIIDTPRVNLNFTTAKSKSIKASKLKFGFIGLGLMGQRLLKNLLDSGHQVTIWNRSSSKCKEFVQVGAADVPTPADVVQKSDIVFACLSDPVASKETVFGSFGVLGEMKENKGYVELSSIDPETSKDISEAIIARGGNYLEAPIIANGKKAAEEGELTIVAAGDKSLYADCSTCFQAMAKRSFFLSTSPGNAVQMSLIVSALYGMFVGAVAECCNLTEAANLQRTDLRDILKLSVLNCPLLDLCMDKIINKSYGSINFPMAKLQKDLRLALNMSETAKQTTPMTATTNEVFKLALRQMYDADVTSVIVAHGT